jgi:hypothetical protein
VCWNLSSSLATLHKDITDLLTSCSDGCVKQGTAGMLWVASAVTIVMMLFYVEKLVTG